MSPRKISIHQVGLGASVRDAAADTMPVVRQMLGELGFNSEIFVDGGERSLRLRVQDLLLIHHCGFQDRFDWLAGLRCRKALIYHGMGLKPNEIATKLGVSERLVTKILLAATARGRR